jgi:ammonium transporter, Amt family
MTASLFEQCAIETNSGDALLILQCVSNSLDHRSTAAAADTSAWLLVLAGALIFFMQTGFAMLCAGCVRKKNLQNTMLKNLLDACGAAIAFFSVGYAFAFGGQGESDQITFAGTSNFFNIGDNVDQGFWFFQFAFSATSVTIVAGTLAERCQMMAYWLYSLFLTGFVYPIVAHALWSDNGFLSPFSASPFQGVGCIDFAGSGVVHVTGGTTALIAAVILGARKGRFHDHRGRLLDDPQPIPGHSMALQLLGTLVLWFGCKLLLWFFSSALSANGFTKMTLD